MPPWWPKLASLAAPQLTEKPWEKKRLSATTMTSGGQEGAQCLSGPLAEASPFPPALAWLSTAPLSPYSGLPAKESAPRLPDPSLACRSPEGV